MTEHLMKSVLAHSKGAGLTPVPSSGGVVHHLGDKPRRVYHLHKAHQRQAAPVGGAVRTPSASDELVKRFMRA